MYHLRSNPPLKNGHEPGLTSRDATGGGGIGSGKKDAVDPRRINGIDTLFESLDVDGAVAAASLEFLGFLVDHDELVEDGFKGRVHVFGFLEKEVGSAAVLVEKTRENRLARSRVARVLSRLLLGFEEFAVKDMFFLDLGHLLLENSHVVDEESSRLFHLVELSLDSNKLVEKGVDGLVDSSAAGPELEQNHPDVVEDLSHHRKGVMSKIITKSIGKR